MKKKLLAFVGILVLLASIGTAYAAPNTNRGYYLDTSYDGLHAIVSTMVGTGSPPAFAFSAKSPDVHQYFASGQLHPRNSCVSADVVHERNVGSSTTTHNVIIGNWCTGGTHYPPYIYSVDLTNATNRSKYVRTNTFNDTGFAFQDEVIEFRVIQTYAPANRWAVYIYNNTTAAYDKFAEVDGTPSNVSGWAEIGDGGYTQDPTMSCPTLYPWGIMQMRAIQKRVSGVWYTITASDITGNITDSWPCLTTNNYQERRTLPYQIKIEPYGVSY